MEVRIELLADGFNLLEAVLLEDFLELREDHLDALLEGLHILCFGRHGALEVVEQRQHVLAEILRDDSGDLFAFLRRAAAEVVEICLEAQQAVLLFLKVTRELLDLALEGLDLLLHGSCLAGGFLRSFLLGALGSIFLRGFRLVDFLLHLLQLLLILLLHFIFDK